MAASRTMCECGRSRLRFTKLFLFFSSSLLTSEVSVKLAHLEIVFLSLLLLVSLCCKHATEVLPGPVEPNIAPIEGVSPVYNEAYRDSIIAIGDEGLYILHKSGTGAHKLAAGPIASVSWTWNKQKILYATPYELYVMNPNGDSVKLISLKREWFNHAVASPDGRRIAYVAKDTTEPGLSPGWIKVMYADGSGSQALTDLQPVPTKVTWTPDSRTVIYNGADKVGRGIFSVSLDNLTPRCLFRDTTMLCNFPALSRNGATLAFTVPPDNRASGNKVFLLDISTGLLRQFTFGNSLDSEPSWSADGNFLVYSRAEYVQLGYWVGSSLWIADIWGEAPHQVSPLTLGGSCWQ